MPVIRRITLNSNHHYGRRLPPMAGLAIMAFPRIIGHAVLMAFRRRSNMAGRKPAWYQAATDIRFVGHEGDDKTDLLFELPLFGEAAEDMYKQKEIWPTKPDANDTGLEVFGDAIHDVASGNRDSDRFDRALLQNIVKLQALFKSAFQEIEIRSERRQEHAISRIDPSVIRTAESFSRTTPNPRRIRLYGTLDMIQASTQGFHLKLLSDEEAPGVLVAGDIGDSLDLFNQEVTVYGKAVYRPSGRLLRIDADEIVPATDKDRFFAKIPHGIPPSGDARRATREQPAKRGIAAIIGKWPGEETDEEVEAALRRLG